MIPEAPVTNATLRSVVRSPSLISAISSISVQRLEDQNIRCPTGVVTCDIPVQRIGNRALQQRTQGTRGVEVNLQAVKFAELKRLIQVARARIRVHPIDLHEVHYVETVVHVRHGNGVKRIRAGGNAVETRRRKKRGEVTREAIQLISAPVRHIPS